MDGKIPNVVLEKFVQKIEKSIEKYDFFLENKCKSDDF